MRTDECNAEKPRILLRLNGMSAAPSRFGIDPAVLPGILEKIRAHESFLELDGYHFHLSGYSTDERIAALESAVSILKQTQARGFACRMINMGGGLAMRYVDAEQWRSFLAAKNSAEFLGERKINDFYPYGNEVSGSEQLATILHGRKECHARIQDVLREHNVRLAIEPGRCLLDQAGITCMTIKGVKIASDGMLLVDVDANINHLSEQWFGKFIHSMINLYRAFLIKTFLNPKTALDVGCGTGNLVKWLRFFGIDAQGIEISNDALNIADASVKPYLKEGDIIKLDYKDEEFDLVLTFDVLEHVERGKIKMAINESIRVSKKYILHKIYTRENLWITWFHARDFSHISVFARKHWQKMFNQIESVSLLRSSFFKLPSFFETIYLLKKKS
jgi:2-polyprenyl-3-methyl-5-hydroxy-6-metoxy-1,4-benzoquinol methylase